MILDNLSFFIVISLSIFLTSFYIAEIYYNPIFILTSQLYYSFITKFVSILYVDLVPVYISETQQYSYFTGASIRFLFYNLIIFISCSLIIRLLLKYFQESKIENHNNKIDNQEVAFGKFLLFSILFVQYLNFILSAGTPLLSDGVSRFNYWQDYAFFSFLPLIFGKLMIFFPFVLGMIIFQDKVKLYRPSTFNIFLLILYFLFLIISGQKFNGLIAPSLYFISIYFILSQIHSFEINYLRMMFFFCIFLFTFLMIGYIDLQNRGITQIAGTGLNVLLYRVFVLQGSSFWSIDELMSLWDIRGNPYDIMYGMETLIREIMPVNIAEKFIEIGINLSGGLPGMSIYSFGPYLGLIFLIVYGIFFGVFSFIIYRLLKNFEIIKIIFASYLIFWIASSYNLSSIEKIVSIKFLFFSFLLFLTFLVSYYLSITKSTFSWKKR